MANAKHTPRLSTIDFTDEDKRAVRHLHSQGLPPMVIGWVFSSEESVINEVLATPPPKPIVTTIAVTITGTDYNVEVVEK